MKAKLQGVGGPAKGVEIALEPGRLITVGRNPACTVSLPGDTFLSGRHFEISVSDQGMTLRDPGSSNGTFLNGARVREQMVLRGGESIVAGHCTFQVRPGADQAPEARDVVNVLSGLREPLYGILDAARDPAIYPMLLSSGGQYASLYTGKTALKLEAVAPYLVLLPPKCELLRQVVARGWGKAWGIFLTSSQSMETVWHELRRSLMVKMEDTGKYVYFRFYDPRVLRVFLPTTEPQQRAELVGTMTSFLLEDEDPTTLLRFHSFATGTKVDKLKVELPPPPPPLVATPPEAPAASAVPR